MDGDVDAGADGGLCGRAPGLVGPSMETDFSTVSPLPFHQRSFGCTYTGLLWAPVVCVICFLAVLSWVVQT